MYLQQHKPAVSLYCCAILNRGLKQHTCKSPSALCFCSNTSLLSAYLAQQCGTTLSRGNTTAVTVFCKDQCGTALKPVSATAHMYWHCTEGGPLHTCKQVSIGVSEQHLSQCGTLQVGTAHMYLEQVSCQPVLHNTHGKQSRGLLYFAKISVALH